MKTTPKRATAALILGIAAACLAFFPYANAGALVLAFVAIGLAVAAVHDCNANPETRTGKGLAVAGIALAVAGIAVSLAVFLVMAALAGR